MFITFFYFNFVFPNNYRFTVCSFPPMSSALTKPPLPNVYFSFLILRGYFILLYFTVAFFHVSSGANKPAEALSGSDSMVPTCLSAIAHFIQSIIMFLVRFQPLQRWQCCIRFLVKWRNLRWPLGQNIMQLMSNFLKSNTFVCQFNPSLLLQTKNSIHLRTSRSCHFSLQLLTV